MVMFCYVMFMVCSVVLCVVFCCWSVCRSGLVWYVCFRLVCGCVMRVVVCCVVAVVRVLFCFDVL